MNDLMLRFTDSASGKLVDFVPANPQRITMYVCGPTVYDYAHIGNARPAVVFDTLFRVLLYKYAESAVVYARNVTDIDDKIIKRSQDSGEPVEKLTQRTLNAYHDDMSQLNVLSPTIEPKATENIKAMIDLMQILLDKGHAYLANDHLLFDVQSYPEYGKLSHRKAEDEQAGARISIKDYKKNPADFVLWKPAISGEPAWDSPFGTGRPGWHLECSAMIHRHLGDGIDIHGGGQDLLFPHHENEIAQSECAYRQPFVRYWLHNGFVTINGQKMSKSLGNITTVHDLINNGIAGEVIRYVLLSSHYRQPVNWDDNIVTMARNNLDFLYRALPNTVLLSSENPDRQVLSSLFNDLNTPLALQRLQTLASEINTEADTQKKLQKQMILLASGQIMGLLMTDNWLRGSDVQLHDYVDKQLLIRENAKKNKDFPLADNIRDKLLLQGIRIKDTKNGTEWERFNV